MTQETLKEHVVYSDGRFYWKKPGMGRIKGRPAGTRNPDGYRKLSILGERLKEHQLVYLYFHGYIPKEIDHINGVRDDNRAENLEWLTAKQNAQHSFKELGRKVKKGNSHYRSHIIDTAMIERLIASGMSHADIVRSTGTTRKVVFCIAHGKHWSQR